jgi:tetratricopeptide (TPR) repeat protein/DNA-binding CsgD family transcriptional regulator
MIVLPCNNLFSSNNSSSQNKNDWNVIKSNIIRFKYKNPDSLKKYLSLAKEFEKQSKLNHLQKIFIEENTNAYHRGAYRLEEALKASREAWRLAHKVGRDSIINKQTYNLAVIFNLMYNSDSAIPYYRKAIEAYRETEDSVFLAKALSGEASALLENGHNKTALERLHEAASIFEKTKMYFEIGKVYDNIGMINAELGYEEKTNKYCRKAIENYKKLDDPVHLAGAYANFGVSCKNLGQYDTAMYYYQESNLIAKQLGDQFLLAKNMLNMGNIYDLQGDFEKSIAHYLSSLEICQKENIKMGAFFNYINLGDLDRKKGNIKEAVSYYLKAIELGETYGFDKIDVVYYNLHETLAEAGRYREALKYLRDYNHYRDSVYKAQKHREIMELQTRFETQKNKAQILKLEKAKQKGELERAYLLLGLVVVVIIALLFILFSWKRHARAEKNALKLEKENQQKLNEMQKLQLEKKLEKEAADKYQLELQMKQQELAYHTLKEAGLNHLIRRTKEKIAPFTYLFSRKKDQEQFTKTIHEIAREVSQDPLADFEEMFIQMHGGFYEKLLEINSGFTRSELQLSALLRMNLPTKEIANLLNLVPSTIDKRRHSIRKKLDLSSDNSLTGFLITL